LLVWAATEAHQARRGLLRYLLLLLVSAWLLQALAQAVAEQPLPTSLVRAEASLAAEYLHRSHRLPPLGLAEKMVVIGLVSEI